MFKLIKGGILKQDLSDALNPSQYLLQSHKIIKLNAIHMTNSKIVVTSNTNAQQLKQELILEKNVTDLELLLEVEVGKEEEIFTVINKHLQQHHLLEGISITFEKYSVFVNFEIIVKGLSYLKQLKKLSFHVKKESYLTDDNLKQLTDVIAILTQLTDLKIFIDSGSSTSYTSGVYIFECIKKLPNLLKLNLQIQNSSFFRNVGLAHLGDSLKSCRNLKELMLHAQFQYQISENISSFFTSISQLTSLEKFELNMCLMNEIPFIIDQLMASISVLKRMKHLKLEPILLVEKEFILPFEQMNTIKKGIDQLNNLEVLILKGMMSGPSFLTLLKQSPVFSQLKEFKSSIKIKESLRSEDLEVEKEHLKLFSQFKNLETLKLSFSSDVWQENYFLESLAKGFESMTNLKELKLDLSMKINQPQRILFLQQLKQLSSLIRVKIIVDSQFDYDQYSINLLGESLMQLHSLEVIEIKGETHRLDFSNFMNSISNLTKLEELSIIFDKCTFVLPFEFRSLTSLRKLRIEKQQEINKKLELPIKFFQDLSTLTNLKELKLSLDTPITKIAQVLGESLLHLTCLESFRFEVISCSYSELSRVIKGLQSQKLNILEIEVEGIKHEKMKNVCLFDCSQTLTNLNLKFKLIDDDSDDNTNCYHEPIFQNLKKFKRLEIFKLNTLSLPSDGIIDLRDYLYSSPQLLNIKVMTISYSDIPQGKFNSQALEQIDLRWRKVKFQGISIAQLRFFESIKMMQNIKKIKIDKQWFYRGEKFTNPRDYKNKPFPQYLGCLSLHVESGKDVDEIQFLRQLKQFKNLKYFDYIVKDKNPALQEEKICELGSSLSQLVGLQSLELNLQFPKSVDDKSLKQLSSGIKQLQNLILLKLKPEQNAQIKGDRLPLIIDSLGSLVNLEQLTIEGYFCEKNLWLENLGRSLSKLENLQSLTCQVNNDINGLLQSIEKGVESIGNSLQHLKCLSILEIKITGHMEIGKQGATSLGKGISSLTQLTDAVLQFSGRGQITQEGAVQIASGLSNLKNLESIELCISGDNEINPDLMSLIISNLSNLRKLNEIKIFLFGFGHLTNPPFAIEPLLNSHSLVDYSDCNLEFKIIDEIFICQFKLTSHTLKINLQCSSDYEKFERSDIILPASVLHNLNGNCKVSVSIKDNKNLKSKSLDQLLESFSSLQASQVDLTLGDLNQVECLQIIEAVSKIQGIKELDFSEFDNQLTYKDYIKAIEFLQLRQSKNLQKLKIEISDELEENLQELNQIVNKLYKFQQLKDLHLDFPSIESDHIIGIMYKQISKKILNLVKLNICDVSFVKPSHNDDSDIDNDDEDDDNNADEGQEDYNDEEEEEEDSDNDNEEEDENKDIEEEDSDIEEEEDSDIDQVDNNMEEEEEDNEEELESNLCSEQEEQENITKKRVKRKIQMKK